MRGWNRSVPEYPYAVAASVHVLPIVRHGRICEVDGDTWALIRSQLCREPDLQAILEVPPEHVRHTRRRQTDRVVERAQAGVHVVHDLEVDLVLCLPDLLHAAHEISPREDVEAEHVTCSGQNDL